VIHVSWNDAVAYCEWLSEKTGKKYRLPTEAEWEYAVRGGQKSKHYKYAGGDELSELAWYNENSGSKTHPVGGKKANELGLYDMSGNVWEWCQDWYGDYSSASQTNPTGASTGTRRVLRGGSWGYPDWNCRVSYRYFNSPTYRNINLGFRLAL
jgi:formylglycine-generating enzyme required for sulfatase activity